MNNINVRYEVNEVPTNILVKTSTFPAGERYVKLLGLDSIPKEDGVLYITLLNASSDAIVDAILCKNAFEEEFKYKMSKTYVLEAPYFPYSRQDRVCSQGESNSFKVIQSILLSQFENIITVDIHNEDVISTRTINKNPITGNYINVFNASYENSIKDVINSDYTIIIPDKGAVKRSEIARKFVGIESIVFFDKKREDGSIIIEPKTEDDVTIIRSRNKFVIFDDICDGGGTFIGIAEKVRDINPQAELVLVVTHGIFSKGTEVLKKYFKEVYVANTEYNKDRLYRTIMRGVN